MKRKLIYICLFIIAITLLRIGISTAVYAAELYSLQQEVYNYNNEVYELETLKRKG